MYQGPFLVYRVCFHLPSGLFRQTLPSTLVHELQKLFLDYAIIARSLEIKTVGSEGGSRAECGGLVGAEKAILLRSTSG